MIFFFYAFSHLGSVFFHQIVLSTPPKKMSFFVKAFVRRVAIASLLVKFACAYNITAELGPILSSDAVIVFPGSVEFLIATDRDNELAPPTFAVVVEVATEADVQKIVRILFW